MYFLTEDDRERPFDHLRALTWATIIVIAGVTGAGYVRLVTRIWIWFWELPW